MITFLAVIIGIVVVAVFAGCFLWPAFIWASFDREYSLRFKILNTVGCVLLIATLITGVMESGVFDSDSSQHCGVGTRYVSETHYSAATKTSITEWQCVVDK